MLQIRESLINWLSVLSKKQVGTPLRALALGIGENKGVRAPDGDQVATADPYHGY